MVRKGANYRFSMMVSRSVYIINVIPDFQMLWLLFFAVFPSPAPCPPQNVNATVRCSNHSALITWMGSPNALGYNVTAIGLGGQIHNCHTNSSSCEVTDLQCGETYSVKVTAYTQTCTGSQSLSHRFRAGGEKNKVLHSVWSHLHFFSDIKHFFCFLFRCLPSE